MTGWLWCEVCKAWRPARTRGAYAYCCHRCGWDMRARVATLVERYQAWKAL